MKLRYSVSGGDVPVGGDKDEGVQGARWIHHNRNS